MSQHDMTIDNGTGSAVRGDINSALGALTTLQSGSSAPSPTFANQWWYDTSVDVLKRRNNANTAWLAIVGTELVRTTSGTVTVGAGDERLIINKAAPSVTPVTLPTVASRLGLKLRIVDFSNNGGDITFTPNGSETIMGQASWILGTGGVLELYPNSTLSGWTI